MQPAVVDLLARRRDRALATLLGVKERELDSFLPPDVRNRYRKLILDVVNGLHETWHDALDSLDDGSVVLNEIYLQRIDEIHERLVVDANR